MSLLDLTTPPASHKRSPWARERIQMKPDGWRLLFRLFLARPSTRRYPLPLLYIIARQGGLSGETGKVGMLWRVRDSYRIRLLLHQGDGTVLQYCHTAPILMPSSQSLGLLQSLFLARSSQQSVQLRCVHACHSFREYGQCVRRPQHPSTTVLGA